jgi:hypothetical protein
MTSALILLCNHQALLFTKPHLFMKMKNLLPAFAALAAFAKTPATYAAVIVNGSFEAPTVTSGTYVNYFSGSTDITGWTVRGFDSAIVSGPFFAVPMVYQAQDGGQFVDLTGDGTNASVNGLGQSVTTNVGQTYALSFYVGSGTDSVTFSASTVDLRIDGGARVSYTNLNEPTDNLDWQLFTVNFTATGPVTDIAFYNGSGPGNNLSALDNVSITAVIPEPSAFALLAGALGLGSALIRRRSRSAG